MNANATPVVHIPRRIPYAIRDKVKAKLDRMEQLGVIVKQREATAWLNSMVTLQKGDKIRICIDPTDVNKVIMREHHPTVTVEVAAQIGNAKRFTKLDARHSYWHIELDDESSKLCTMNTVFGRYRFLRLPFGLRSSGDIMQRAMENILDCVKVIVDDTLVWGNTDDQHDERVRQVLDRLNQSGLKLNHDKAEVVKEKVNYVGHTLTPNGIKPDSERIRALVNMPTPTNKQEVHRILGVVTYVAKLIPNLSNISAPLRELVKDYVEFAWKHEQNTSFETLKELITSAPVLKFYDVKKPITLSVDSSKDGLGGCILQDDQPIAYQEH